MKRVSIIMTAILFIALTSCSLPRVIDYTENSAQRAEEFNAVVFRKSGTVVLRDSAMFGARDMNIAGQLLSFTDTKTGDKKEVPLTRVRSVKLSKKVGLPGAILGFIGGVLPVLMKRSGTPAVYIVSGTAGALAMSQLPTPHVTYNVVIRRPETIPISYSGTSAATDGSATKVAISVDSVETPSHSDSITHRQAVTSENKKAAIPGTPANTDAYKFHKKNLDFMNRTDENIKDFNRLAYHKIGKVLLLDSTAYAGTDFCITDSLITWTDVASNQRMSTLFSVVQSVEIIEKPGIRKKTGISVLGMLTGALAGWLIVATIYNSTHKEKEVDPDKETGPDLEGIEYMILGVVGGAVVGASIGSASAERDTKITVVFHEPVGQKSKLRQDPERFKVQSVNSDPKTEN